MKYKFMMMLSPPYSTVGMVPGFLQTWLLAFRSNSSILVSSDQRILFRMVCESFWQTPSLLSCAFYWGVASVWPLYHKGLIDGVLQRCLSWKFFHLNRGNVKLCQIDHRIIGHLPDQGPSPPTALFGRVASSRKCLGGSKLLPFQIDGGHCILGDLQCCRHFWNPSPDLCLDTVLSRSSTDNSFGLMAWFLLWHAMSTVGAYLDRCVTFLSCPINWTWAQIRVS